MQRATKAKAAPRVKAGDKPLRYCKMPGCDKVLAPAQRSYCTLIHRYQALSLAKGNGGGRPVVIPEHVYKPEYATTKFEEYLKWCEERNKQTFIPVGKGLTIINNAELPSQYGYAKFLGVNALGPLEQWIRMRPEFALAMDRLKLEQLYTLGNLTLAGRYNPLIGKLFLSVNHGMIERRETDHRHKLLGFVKHIYQEADRLELEEGNDDDAAEE